MNNTLKFLSEALSHTITYIPQLRDLLPIIDKYYSYLVRRKTYNIAKHFEINTYKTDIDKFKLYGDKFIDEYIYDHNNIPSLTRESVYSLLLNSAVILEDIETIQHILSTFHEENILTYTDELGYSPISLTLESGNINILHLIELYIEKYSKYIVKQNSIYQEDHSNLITILEFPQFEHLSVYEYYGNYLTYLYTEEALKDIREFISDYYEC